MQPVPIIRQAERTQSPAILDLLTKTTFAQPQSKISRDKNISLLSVSLLQKIARGLIAWLVVVSLLVPIVILNALTSTALRLMVIVIASALLIAAIAGLTRAKTVEVFVSGAT